MSARNFIAAKLSCAHDDFDDYCLQQGLWHTFGHPL